MESKVFVVLWHTAEGPNCDVYSNRTTILDAYDESIAPALDRAERSPGEPIELGWKDEPDLIVRYCTPR